MTVFCVYVFVIIAKCEIDKALPSVKSQMRWGEEWNIFDNYEICEVCEICENFKICEICDICDICEICEICEV